jgi:hypothetical protein
MSCVHRRPTNNEDSGWWIEKVTPVGGGGRVSLRVVYVDVIRAQKDVQDSKPRPMPAHIDR